ncbi:MAG: response regulator [Nitrosopumilus sp.]|nr:response regulator [Nitrosopumilus sp.]
MKVLIAEDDPDIALTYKLGLERKNHQVTTLINGEDCLKRYNEELHRMTFNPESNQSSYCSLANNPPFDIVLLDYKMPQIDGLEVAKEILSINPHQRIIFASAYVKQTLEESVKILNQVVELIQKPFTIHELINTIEDTKVYDELQKLNVDVDLVKAITPTHEQIIDLLEKVKDMEKGRTC